MARKKTIKIELPSSIKNKEVFEGLGWLELGMLADWLEQVLVRKLKGSTAYIRDDNGELKAKHILGFEEIQNKLRKRLDKLTKDDKILSLEEDFLKKELDAHKLLWNAYKNDTVLCTKMKSVEKKVESLKKKFNKLDKKVKLLAMDRFTIESQIKMVNHLIERYTQENIGKVEIR